MAGKTGTLLEPNKRKATPDKINGNKSAEENAISYLWGAHVGTVATLLLRIIKDQPVCKIAATPKRTAAIGMTWPKAIIA